MTSPDILCRLVAIFIIRMKFHKNKFLAFIAGAALVLAVGACSSSSSDDDEMAGTPPPATTDPTPESTPELTAAEQLTAANEAFTAAEVLVDALMSSSTPEEAAEAYDALGKAQAAVHAATNLPANQIAKLQGQVDQLVLDLDAANMVATQAASVKTALATATTMVDGLTNDSTDTDVTAARGAVTAAQTALDATADLPQDVSDNLGTLISSLDSRLGDIETAHMGIDPDVIAEGMRVAMAIGPDSTRPDSNADMNEAQMPFMANGRKLTEDPATPDDMDDDFAMAAYAPASITGWQGAKYTRTKAADAVAMTPEMTDTVVRYTDQADPTDQAYSVYYSDDGAGTRDGVESGSNGVLMLDTEQTGHHGLFSIAFGITAAHQEIPIEHDDLDTDAIETETEYMGMFNGVPGTYTCTGTCSVESNAMGNLSMLNGTWTFEPAEVAEGTDPHMVAGVIPDPDYLTFGQWRRDTVGDDGTESGISAFAMGNTEHDAVVTGTAKYAGPASGTYMKKTFDGDGNPTPIASGQFTADSELTAYFGQLNDDAEEGTIAGNLLNSISGSVKFFKNSAGDMINPGWTVELNKTDIESGGDFTGTTTGMGAYSGQFYGPDMNAANEQLMPSAAAGTFDGHFSNGHVLGAFAARKK